MHGVASCLLNPALHGRALALTLLLSRAGTRTAVCHDTMDQTVDLLRSSLVVMEDFHQGVYLGFDKLSKPDDDVYGVWTKHSVNYTVRQAPAVAGPAQRL